MPKRLLVLGGGIIGLEMATVYSELGAAVTIVELLDQIIPGADKDIVAPLTKRIAQALRGHPPEDQGHQGRGRGRRADGHASRAARRRRPRPSTASWWPSAGAPTARPIGAENAGVAVDERGFIAGGQAAAHQRRAHLRDRRRRRPADAGAQGGRTRARSPPRSPPGKNSFFDAEVIPSVAYTDPEVAWVGITENEAKAAGVKYGKGVFPWAASGRSLSLGRDEGMTKLLFDESHRPRHRLRRSSARQRRRPDRRGRAGDRDGRRRRGHRPDHPPAPDPVGDRRHGGGGVRGHHHRPLPAEAEEVAGAFGAARPPSGRGLPGETTPQAASILG